VRNISILLIYFLIGFLKLLDGEDFSLSYNYILFSNSKGLWITFENKSPQLLYNMMPGWEITSIVIDTTHKYCYFTEKYHNTENQNVWTYSNAHYFKLIERPRDHVSINTIIGSVNSNYLYTRTFTYIFPSLNGQYIVVQEEFLEAALFHVFKKFRRMWNYIDSVPASQFHWFLGWDYTSEKFYYMKEDMEMPIPVGLFTNNVNLTEEKIVFDDRAVSISIKYQMYLTIPWALPYKKEIPIKLMDLGNGNLIKIVYEVFDGHPNYYQYSWNPKYPSVLLFQRDHTPKRDLLKHNLTIISSIDSLNKSYLISGDLSYVNWDNTGENCLFTRDGKLFYFNLKEEEEDNLLFFDENIEIELFKVIWK